MRMDIRLLDSRDRAAFRGLRLIALGSDPESFMMTTEEERNVPRLMVEKFLDFPTSSSFFLGAFDEGEIKGMIGAIGSAYAKRRHIAEILSLYVHPNVRGRGIGRRLLGTALDRVFSAPQIRRVKLSVVASNMQAIALYQAFGFVECGREPDAYAIGERSWDLVDMSLGRPSTMYA